MSRPTTLSFGFALLLLLLSPAVLARNVTTGASPAASGQTMAVADFSGKDRELGRFLAETLLTDLAQSDRLQLVERAELHRALTELKLQSTGLTEPRQIKRVGQLVGVAHLIVGSYLLYNDQIIINARLLDVRTGRLVPGGAAHVTGSRHDIASAVHRLAEQFHRHVTGSALPQGDSPSLRNVADTPETPARPPVETDSEDLRSLRQGGLIPPNVRANDALLERDLAALVARVRRQVGTQTDPPLTATQSHTPVTRLRALTAFVKLFVSPEATATYRDAPAHQMPPDAETIPPWGWPYAAAAVEQGWWRADRPLRARDLATWAFVGAILQQMPIEERAYASPRRTADNRAQREEDDGSARDPDGYTGLIVDARDLRLWRSMSLRILDEDGRVIYPDPRHLPDYDFLQEQGMAAYNASAQEARRAGNRPMIVRAANVAGPGHDDLIVSNETAERIRAANRRSGFLRRWAVCVLVEPR